MRASVQHIKEARTMLDAPIQSITTPHLYHPPAVSLSSPAHPKSVLQDGCYCHKHGAERHVPRGLMAIISFCIKCRVDHSDYCSHGGKVLQKHL